MQDRIGYDLGFTLLSLGQRPDGGALAKAFASVGAPFRVLELRDERARALYGHDFILLRPDLHIVWRGNSPPADPARLAALATGHAH